MPKRTHIRNRFVPDPQNTRRVTRPSRFGNPFVVERTAEAHEVAVILFKSLRETDPEYRELIRRELAGYDLACSCPLKASLYGIVE